MHFLALYVELQIYILLYSVAYQSFFLTENPSLNNHVIHKTMPALSIT